MKTSMFTLLLSRLICNIKVVRVLGSLGLSLGVISSQAYAQALPIPVAPAQIVQPSLPTPLQTPSQINQAPDAAQFNKPSNQVTAVEPVTSGAIDDSARADILKTFQKEARAAYAEAQTACKDLEKDQQAVCLAKARIQFDQDMQYAQKRANMGF